MNGLYVTLRMNDEAVDTSFDISSQIPLLLHSFRAERKLEAVPYRLSTNVSTIQNYNSCSTYRQPIPDISSYT